MLNVFKENLTSKLLQKESLRIIDKTKKEINILELGCGNGNITNYLISNQKRSHAYFLSDISEEAIKEAKKNIKQDSVTFKIGSYFDPWKGKKFDLIISDISSINDEVANKSEWYNGVVCQSGEDGLNNVNEVLKNISSYLNKDGFFILPIISLSAVNLLEKKLKSKFKKVVFSKKTSWPLPPFFEKNIKVFQKYKNMGHIDYEYKYGIHIAFTAVATCQSVK